MKHTKEGLENMSDSELNVVLKTMGLNPAAHEDRETAIDLIVQLSNQ